MIDKDGIERPDSSDVHIMSAPRSKQVSIDENYVYYSKSKIRNFFCYLLHAFVYFVLAPFFKVKYSVKVQGRKNLKSLKRKSFVTIYNHVHVMDTTMISVSVFRFRLVRYMAIKENIQMPVAGKLIKMLGAFPIPEGYNNLKRFNKAIDEMLNDGQVLFVAPEGSMWHEYRGIRPFKLGAFNFACRNNVPIVPIVVSFRLKKTLIRRKPVKKITLRIYPAEYPDNNLDRKTNEINLRDKMQDFYTKTIQEAYPDIY